LNPRSGTCSATCQVGLAALQGSDAVVLLAASTYGQIGWILQCILIAARVALVDKLQAHLRCFFHDYIDQATLCADTAAAAAVGSA
jgi:hypothetical protein